MNIEKIRIEGLFGEVDYDIKFDKNKLILVAENGSGKTTIVNIIYYFLSKQWSKLFRYNFKKISAVIDGKTHTIDRDEINVSSLEKVKKYLKRRYSVGQTDYMTKKVYEQLLSIDMSEVYRNPGRIELLAERFDLPPQIIYEIANVASRQQLSLFDDNFSEKELKISNDIDCQILYLPTFRRIEQDLKAIFPDLEEDIEKYNRRRKRNRNSGEESYVELVEFGMEDVEEKIRTKFSEIRENLSNKIKNNLTGGYLKDIINKTYRETSYEQIQAINEKALGSILGRIDETVLSKNEKSRLIEFVKEIKQQSKIDEVENKIVAHFIYRLSKIFDELKEEERDIENFVNICNEYSTNKNLYMTV